MRQSDLTYRQAVDYLLNQLPMFQRQGASAYRVDLTNIRALADMFGNPQNDFKSIHIAGTNGKGSVCHFLASILQEQGYKVGLFVSPHYKDYRERIKLNGRKISRAFVTRFVAENMERFKTINASFFEISAIMAFEYFKHSRVDFAIIETGMGGRLDSTNIIKPVLSVITNISFDHQQFLGNTLPLIAREKAGIIKPGVPVVIGEKQKETLSVFREVAKANQAPLHVAAQLFVAAPHYPKQLLNRYQKKNINTTLKAIEVLNGLGYTISPKAVKSGFRNLVENTSFIGRWMVVQQSPKVIFDSAHNPGGIAEVVANLKAERYKTLHIVFGTVNDKDISGVLKLLPEKAVYYFTRAQIPRALPAEQLHETAKTFRLTGYTYNTVKQALKKAIKSAEKGDLVLVTGSVFVVAEVV